MERKLSLAEVTTQAGAAQNVAQFAISQDASGGLWVGSPGGGHTRIYSLSEGLRKAGITAATYYAWVTSGRIPDSKFKNDSVWRLLTEEEVGQLVQMAKISDNGSHNGGT